MATGMFRTVDGLVMVEYGKRQGAISRALYKANRYRPVYEKLTEKSAYSAKVKSKTPRTKKTSPSQESFPEHQSWLRGDSRDCKAERQE